LKRIERIFEYIRQESGKYKKEQLKGQVGLDAQQIAEALDILRNNVSMELNVLHRQNRIVKILGRPVRYFDRETLENLGGADLGAGPLEFRAIEECIKDSGGGQSQPFERLIGAETSLKVQVEQAKAAILYPPDGLHTLIVGQTGVGKTLFAHMMFEYGKVMHRFAEDAPFITFNCADYYNNPQLLISHIFGHIKGAFTGADSAKTGLVEEADGGILFLDEIHRLPPEGQEMIFYFMDTGTFNRLGETARSRSAKVLIIGATTEDPDSALTKTFVRRIPNIIAIKPLAERSLPEKLDIIKLLFGDEAQRVKKPVRISVESIKALIGSIGNGNVGQLKSNIKLLCAQAFLNGLDNPDYIEVDFRMLPPNVKNGLLTLSANRHDLSELAKYIDEPLVITPSGEKRILEESESDRDAFNLYRVVEDKVKLLKGEGISASLIKQMVASDVNVYINSLYNRKDSVSMTTRERLLKIVDASLVDFSEQVSLVVQKRLNRSYRDRFLYAFSLHLSAFLKRVKANETIPYTEIGGEIQQDSPYFQVALEIKDLIEKQYHISVPQVEVAYIGLLLESSEDDDLEEHVVILVATHGKSTATSMVEVAQKLFSVSDTNLIPVDMPLDVKPQEILDKMVTLLRGMNCSRGVLILADMGSLCNFGSMLTEQLGIKVRTLDMVSTPLILEAMRKADMVGMDIDSIYESLRTFKGYETVDFAGEEGTGRREAIVTICSTGQGAALKLKALVEEILHHTGRGVEVIPIGLVKMEEKIRGIMEEYKVIGAVGMKKPKLDIPFIPLEQLIGGDGEQMLTELVFSHELSLVPRERNNLVVHRLCEESLQKFLTYLNPAKVMGVLLDFDAALEKELGKSFTNPIRIRLIVHCGCALERVVIRAPLVYKSDKSKTDGKKLEALRKAAAIFEKTLKLSIEEDELYFMANMI